MGFNYSYISLVSFFHPNDTRRVSVSDYVCKMYGVVSYVNLGHIVRTHISMTCKIYVAHELKNDSKIESLKSNVFSGSMN